MNFLNGLARASNVLAALNGLIPVIGALTQEAEALFPNTGTGTGAQKLVWVQNILKNTLAFSGHAIQDIELFLPQVTNTINTIVAAAKGSPVPPAVAPVAPVAPTTR